MDSDVVLIAADPSMVSAVFFLSVLRLKDMRLKFEPHPEHKIGEGTQKRAYRDPERDPESVALEFKNPWRNEEIKAMFYIQKIAHLLFPEETIAVKQVGNVETDEGTRAYARTEYVSPAADPTHIELQELLAAVEGYAWDLEGESEEKFDAVFAESRKDKKVQAWYRAYAKAGLENRLAAFGRQDRINDGEGNFKFVDIAVPWYIDDEDQRANELLFEPKKLKRAIAALPDRERRQAEVYYDRLIDLCRSVGFTV